jgi:hypothetical protein
MHGGDRPGRPGTRVDVLLSHGLPRDVVDRLREIFPSTETVAASLSHHQARRCGDLGPQPCPWHPDRPLGPDTATVTVAVNAWCAVGLLERDILRGGPPW